MTEDAIRAELVSLALKVESATVKQDTWATAHDASLTKLDKSLTMTNTSVQQLGSELAIVQTRCVDRGKRISGESERIDKLEMRVRSQEDTGVHHLGETQGEKKAREATRKGFLFAFAVLGALATLTGLVLGAIKLAG